MSLCLRLFKVLSGWLIFGSLLSLFTLAYLNFWNVPYPWVWLLILKAGFVRPVILGFLTTLILSAIAFLLYCYPRFLRVVGIELGCYLAAVLGILNLYYAWKGWPLSMNPLGVYAIYLQLPHLLQKTYVTAVIFSHLMGVIAAMLAILKHFKNTQHYFGNAHFATLLEILQDNFFKKEPNSLALGKVFNRYLYSQGFEHVLVFAPTGSGKSRSIAIPNALLWEGSCVINDVKQELFEATSGYREKQLENRCYLLAFSGKDGKTHRYNPLSFISDNKLTRMDDIQKLAHILIPDRKGDPIWYRSSRKLFTALLLYVLDSDCPKTLGQINRLIKRPNFYEWLVEILANTTHLDPTFYREGYSYTSVHEKTRASILETFVGYLELFNNPLIDSLTSHSDFDLRQLRKEKMTIYVSFSLQDLERLSPLLTIFWNQLISVMTENIPDVREEPYPVLCLMDEFSALGRINQLRDALKLLRAYRLRCIIMLQYIAQTFERYSHDEAQAFTNIRTKVAFAQDSLPDAEYVSKLLGTRTVKVLGGSSTSHVGSMGSSTENYHYQAIPLLRPEEVQQLAADKGLIMQTGKPPVLANQCIWYEDKKMASLRLEKVSIPVQALQLVEFDHGVKHSNLDKKTLNEKALQEIKTLSEKV